MNRREWLKLAAAGVAVPSCLGKAITKADAKPNRIDGAWQMGPILCRHKLRITVPVVSGAGPIHLIPYFRVNQDRFLCRPPGTICCVRRQGIFPSDLEPQQEPGTITYEFVDRATHKVKLYNRDGKLRWRTVWQECDMCPIFEQSIQNCQSWSWEVDGKMQLSCQGNCFVGMRHPTRGFLLWSPGVAPHWSQS